MICCVMGDKNLDGSLECALLTLLQSFKRQGIEALCIAPRGQTALAAGLWALGNGVPLRLFQCRPGEAAGTDFAPLLSRCRATTLSSRCPGDPCRRNRCLIERSDTVVAVTDDGIPGEISLALRYAEFLRKRVLFL